MSSLGSVAEMGGRDQSALAALGMVSNDVFERRLELIKEGFSEASSPGGRHVMRAFPRLLGLSPKGKPIWSVAGAGEHLFMVANSTLASTAAPVKQPTGSAIRTMLQIAAPSGSDLQFVEWGISFDGVSSAAVPVQCEFFGTSVAATMSTALAATDVSKFNQPTGDATAIQFSTTTSAYATAAVTEGTVANYRLGDLQLISPTAGYVKQWPLGREFVIDKALFLRVRVTAAATVNAYIYVIWAE